MLRSLRVLFALALFFLSSSFVRPAEPEMVPNPFYKFWASFKPGSTALMHESSKLGNAESKILPDGVDDKRIAYKLLEVNDKRVVVETVVTEQEFLGFIQTAPTRHIYPAQVKKAHLERFLQETHAKRGEETVKFKDKELKCRTIAGTLKGADGEDTDYKLWLSDEVPGSIVKQTRTTRQKDKLVADTTTQLESYKKVE